MGKAATLWPDGKPNICREEARGLVREGLCGAAGAALLSEGSAQPQCPLRVLGDGALQAAHLPPQGGRRGLGVSVLNQNFPGKSPLGVVRGSLNSQPLSFTEPAECGRPPSLPGLHDHGESLSKATAQTLCLRWQDRKTEQLEQVLIKKSRPMHLDRNMLHPRDFRIGRGLSSSSRYRRYCSLQLCRCQQRKKNMGDC
nr:uncharacterized protein LOC103890769 [Pongo abelii]